MNEDHLLAERIDYRGLTIKIRYEEYVESFLNPRQDDGTLGVMLTAHRDYEFGGATHDEQIDSTWEPTVECRVCNGNGTTDQTTVRNVAGYGWQPVATFDSQEDAEYFIDHHPDGRYVPGVRTGLGLEPSDCHRCNGTGEITLPLDKYLREERGARVILPLGLYEHSGITMFVGHRGDYPFDGQGWDTSNVGVYFDTTETRAECGVEDWTDERLEESMRQEIDVYDSYLRGEVYWYAIYEPNPEDEDDDGELLDSCGGFVGDEKYAIEEAKSQADWYADRIDQRNRNNELALANWRY